MKKILFLLVLAISNVSVFAGTKLISGTIAELSETNVFPVYIDWSQAVYAKSGTLADFLNKAERNPNWEEESLKYFFQEINSQTGEFGKRFIKPEESGEYDYTIIICPTKITKGGDIEGTIVFNKKGEDDPLAVIFFSSDESDDNDKIAFRDQFESIGESLGKLFKKQLKKKS